MTKYGSTRGSRNGFVTRILYYIIITLIVPFLIKRIKNKFLRDQRQRCHDCNRKLIEVKKNEYYCKYCKIIRMDTGE